MALTINPAVSGTHRKWLRDAVSFFSGTFVGALLSVLILLVALAALSAVLPRLWVALAIAVPILWAVLHDLGLRLPLPYRRQQVPEVLRHVLPASAVAFIYGFQLGVGFLTLFTYSTQLAFILVLPLVESAAAILAGVALFALGKTLVLTTALGTSVVEEIPDRFRSSQLQTYALRSTNALASLVVLGALFAAS